MLGCCEQFCVVVVVVVVVVCVCVRARVCLRARVSVSVFVLVRSLSCSLISFPRFLIPVFCSCFVLVVVFVSRRVYFRGGILLYEPRVLAVADVP